MCELRHLAVGHFAVFLGLVEVDGLLLQSVPLRGQFLRHSLDLQVRERLVLLVVLQFLDLNVQTPQLAVFFVDLALDDLAFSLVLHLDLRLPPGCEVLVLLESRLPFEFPLELNNLGLLFLLSLSYLLS